VTSIADLLRLRAPGANPADAVAELLGFLEVELDADVEDTGWRQGRRLDEAAPVLVALESLEVAVSADGNEVLVRHVAGSRLEFEELCQLIGDWRDGG
jgi:hypothetical protein